MRFSKNPPATRATPRCFGLDCAMLFAPAEDTFDHLAALLRLVITPMPCRAAIDRASSPLTGFGRALVLRYMRRDADGTQVSDMIFRVIS